MRWLTRRRIPSEPAALPEGVQGPYLFTTNPAGLFRIDLDEPPRRYGTEMWVPGDQGLMVTFVELHVGDRRIIGQAWTMDGKPAVGVHGSVMVRSFPERDDDAEAVWLG